MASRECPTCYDGYDTGEHRVRMLYCGHSQCSACMRAQFSNGSITCAACRQTHAYPDVTSIPVNFTAETMLCEKEKEASAPLAPKLHKGICEEHAAYKLFWCNTHQEWICTHCSVTEHPRGDCEIIPIKKYIETAKLSMKSKISEELNNLDCTENEVKLSMEEIKKQTEEEKDQIKKMKKLISQKEKEISVLDDKHSKLKAITDDCMEKKSALGNFMTRLHNANNFRDLDLQIEKCASIIQRNENWRKDLEEDTSISLTFGSNLPNILEKLMKETNGPEKKTMIENAKKMMKKEVKKTTIYVAKTIQNTVYYSLIEEKQGCTLLYDLQENLAPIANSALIEFDSIMSLVPSPPVAFLTFTYRGNTTLGRLHIRLDGLPRRAQQFLELASGSGGHGGYRGARIDNIGSKGTNSENVRCNGFKTAAGEMKTNALFQLEVNGSIPREEGVVFSSGQSAHFWIITKTYPNATWAHPLIGHVTEGLPEFQAAVAKYGDRDIVFSNCGLVIDESG